MTTKDEPIVVEVALDDPCFDSGGGDCCCHVRPRREGALVPDSFTAVQIRLARAYMAWRECTDAVKWKSTGTGVSLEVAAQAAAAARLQAAVTNVRDHRDYRPSESEVDPPRDVPSDRSPVKRSDSR
ncbi:MAG: hypothetical protein U0974_02165 [Gemmatimonadales bacterium]|nr:hypothetical protein [Gemmatimonadales bacterium]